MSSLTRAIFRHAIEAPNRVAISYSGSELSYSELERQVRCCSGMLNYLGIQEGDVVALLMKNSSTYIVLGLAISHIGGIILPINYRLAEKEIGFILGHSLAAHLFVDEEFLSSVDNFGNKTVVSTSAQSDASVLLDGEFADVPTSKLDPESTYRLMYTSGTTDHPKGVIHSYANFYWKSLAHIIALDISKDDRLLICGPLYHVGAYDLPGVSMLLQGGMICILRDFDPEVALGVIESQQLTCGWLAPVMLAKILSLPDAGRFNVSTIRWIIGGGERTPEQRIRDFNVVFKNGRYVDGYGLTETCSGDTFMPAGWEIAKIGSVGLPLANVEIEIRNSIGISVPCDVEGEICVRGPKVTKGYWRDPQKTESCFYPDGFLRTGDVGYLDADGFLFITDRLKDMIISGGENIASSEVERVIYELDQILETAVIGVPDDKWGERLLAVVVLKPGMTLNAAELEAHCRKSLAGFKVPRDMRIIEALPRNPSGKVLKRDLRERFQ